MSGAGSVAPLVVVILTLNEELNLPKALASIDGRAPVVVVDSGSTDRTEEIARAAGAEFIAHPFVDYASQRNFALEQVARHPWVFFLDADEELSPPLWNDLEEAIAEEGLDGAYVRLDLRVLGRALTHGEFRDARILRLMRPSARFRRGVNERVDDRGMRVRTLPTRLIHRDLRPLSQLFIKHVRYAQREATNYLDEPRTLAGFSLRTRGARRVGVWWLYNQLPLFVRPFLNHARTVLLQGAWRDGIAGLVHAGMHTLWYPMLIDLLIYEEKLRRSGALEPRDPDPR
ncbi:MAG: glycosyltransferase family 2 protein [Nannocystaceae bacterium]